MWTIVETESDKNALTARVGTSEWPGDGAGQPVS